MRREGRDKKTVIITSRIVLVRMCPNCKKSRNV